MNSQLGPRTLVHQSDQLRAAGRVADALRCIDAAIACAPDDAIAHCKRGQLLKSMRRWSDALECFERGIALQPSLAPAHLDRGNVLQELGRLVEALLSYDRALELQPRFSAALCNRGTVLHRLNRLDEAIASYDAALVIDPSLDEAHFNRATTLADRGRFAEALEGFQRTTVRYPQLAVAHWNEALCRLRLGDFALGWSKFEWRWRYSDLCLRERACPQPKWLGQDDICGRTLLLHAEQGLGDTLQFCRFASLLCARGARVILQVDRPLVTLLKTLPGPDAVIAEGEAPPPIDYHTPLLSLPLALGTTLTTIPAQVPYLRVDPHRVRLWAERLPPVGKRSRIGLVWSGNPRHPNDANRSLHLESLRVLTALDADFVALQNQVWDRDRGELERQAVLFFGSELIEFVDTAALAANMDLVITVDTACAHLAGALGLPVWIMLPFAADWRWFTERSDSPWYPSARLFRQRMPGDWQSVVQEVGEQLQSLIEARRRGQPDAVPLHRPD